MFIYKQRNGISRIISRIHIRVYGIITITVFWADQISCRRFKPYFISTMIKFVKEIFTVCICCYNIGLTCCRIIDRIAIFIQQMDFHAGNTILTRILNTIFVFVIPDKITQRTAYYRHGKGVGEYRKGNTRS